MAPSGQIFRGWTLGCAPARALGRSPHAGATSVMNHSNQDLADTLREPQESSGRLPDRSMPILLITEATHHSKHSSSTVSRSPSLVTTTIHDRSTARK